MRHLLRLAALFLMGSILLAPTKPISKVPFIVSQGKDKAPVAHAGVLFQHGDFNVYKTTTAASEDFIDLYWVNFANREKHSFEIARFGEILHFQPNQFAVVRIQEELLEELTNQTHGEGMPCGAIVKLNGDVMISPAAAPEPIVDINTKLESVQAAIALLNPDTIRATVDRLSQFQTRYYTSETGKQVPGAVAAMYRDLLSGRDDVEVELFDHANLPQDSVIIRIVGQSRPDEIVVLGSHIDSINGFGSGRAPGVDDNASGTATNLEVFRILMASGIKLERTLEIHGYAAEEIGLVGSQDIAAQYRDQGKNVVAMVQHDMNLFNQDGIDKIWFVTNSTHGEFNTQLKTLARSYLSVAIGEAPLFGGSSDHASWTRSGYAAAFPFENPNGYNRQIHTANDTIASSGKFSQANEFVKLGLAYLGHFAGFVQ